MNARTTHLLIRHHEIAIKGKNRPEFERRLWKSLAKGLGSGGVVKNLSGRFVIELRESGIAESDKIIERISALGGISAITPCTVLPLDTHSESESSSEEKPGIDRIIAEALEWARDDLAHSPDAKTFAVRARRINKKFPLSSNQVDIAIGEKLRFLRDGLTVDLKNPDVKVALELRHKHALIYSNETAGVRGLPMDATQRVVCLLSGGIDSPVAAHEIMRRGCAPVFVHFHSKPFTSEASISKVKRLATVLRASSPMPLELWLVPLLEIQKAVRDLCNERHRTIHYRRYMMMIAEELAGRRGAKAVVTGDALGQVASQTLSNLQAIEEPVRLPVLRPLVALDKVDIVNKARKIGTYEISIEPHDDTCVLFAPKNPATQAKLSALREEAEQLPQYQLIFSALDAAEKVLL